jgi:SagB-type dehydrogenase family enzyme
MEMKSEPAELRRPRRSRARAAGERLALAMLATVCLCLIMGCEPRVEVVASPESSAAEPTRAEGRGELVEAVPLARRRVRVDGVDRPIADYYHERTKLSPLGLGNQAPLRSPPPPGVFKPYPEAATFPLPEHRGRVGVATGEAIARNRRPLSGFRSEAVSLEDLATLLHASNGITASTGTGAGTHFLRAAPSAGALYPTVTYVVARDVSGLPAGLYHYAVNRGELHQLRVGGSVGDELAELVDEGHYVRQAPVTLVFASMFFRSSWKYRERSYRYSSIDCGHLTIQAALTAAALGLGARPIGRFDDARVNALLGLDEDEESALLVLPVGRPSPDAPASVWQPVFRPDPKPLQAIGHPLLGLMHGETRLAATEQRAVPLAPRGPEDKPYPDLRRLPLPRDLLPGDDLVAGILRRRSIRDWEPRGMTLQQLSSVFYYSFGVPAFDVRHPDGGQWLDPSVEDNHALQLYLVVHDVEGVEPGVYYYRREDHALSQIRRGSLRRQMRVAAAMQKFVGDSGAVLVITIDRDRMIYPDADRGYRYATLDAGMLGGRVYLQTTSLGLGCTGVGALFEDRLSQLIDVSPEREHVVYTLAIGVKAGAP